MDPLAGLADQGRRACVRAVCTLGRTGRRFGIEHGDVVPDLLTFAKGVNSGSVPLGGVAISERINETFAERATPEV